MTSFLICIVLMLLGSFVTLLGIWITLKVLEVD